MSLSGEYLATHDGYWQGTKGYDENKAAFRVQLYNLKLTFREYKEKMNNSNSPTDFRVPYRGNVQDVRAF